MKPPEFRFDSPPPFTYEEFKTQHMGKVLSVLDGPGGDYLKTLQGPEMEFLTGLFYLLIVIKLQNPDVSKPELLYAVNYGMARHFLDNGLSPESARQQLSSVPWDTLPGLDAYDRESANAIAVRAVEDAVAGRPQAPLH
jgi:hypothetical protein